MILYAKTKLDTGIVESIGSLPSYLAGLSPDSLADMSWCAEAGRPELVGYGYLPVSVDPVDDQVLAWINAQRASRGLPAVSV